MSRWEILQGLKIARDLVLKLKDAIGGLRRDATGERRNFLSGFYGQIDILHAADRDMDRALMALNYLIEIHEKSTGPLKL